MPRKVYELTGGITTGHRFAVLGDKERFRKYHHAWRAWSTLKEWGCQAYPVAERIARLSGSKVYPELAGLKGKIDVIVPCRLPEDLAALATQAQEAGAQYVWFQEQTWSEQLEEECMAAGLQVVRGCVLRHKKFGKVFGYLSPCYWHGLGDNKVPRRL